MWECICAAPNQPAFEVRYRIASLTGRSRVVCSQPVRGFDPSLEQDLASAVDDRELARKVRVAVVTPDDHSFCFKRAVIGGNVLLIYNGTSVAKPVSVCINTFRLTATRQ